MTKSALKIYAAIFILLFLISCKKESQNIESKIFVLSEITAGDSAIIPLGKTIKVGNGETIAFEKLTAASVQISEENSTSINLHWNNSADFLSNPVSIYTHPNIFKATKIYSLQINQQGLPAATATTHIPAAFSVRNVDAKDKEFNGKEVLQFSFSINDAASEKNYYLFEAVKQLVLLDEYFYWQGVKYDYNTSEGKQMYDQVSNNNTITILKDTVPTNQYLRLNLYTSDLNTENEEFSGSLDSSFHRIFLTDSLFNGASYSTSFTIDKSYFQASAPNQKGRVLIRVKSVSKDLFDYLSLYEKYRSEFGILPPQNLSSPTGNIQNGIGVFGGSYKNEWVFYYDDL